MKELTMITTVEITEIEKLTDEEYDFIMNHTEEAKRNVQAYMKDTFNQSDDIHTKVQIFVRDDNND